MSLNIDPTREGKFFRDFLETPGDHKTAIRAMAVSCYAQIRQMGLPQNHHCVEFLTHIIDEASFATDESNHLFRHFSELDQHGPKFSEEEKEENTREYDALRDALINSKDEKLAKALARATMKKSSLQSQGFDENARNTLVDFINRKHLKTIARLSADAASFAMMDPDAGTDPEIDQIGRTSGDRYDMLVRNMRYSLAMEVTDQMQLFFRTERKLTSGQAQRLMNAIFKDPEPEP